MASIQCAVTAMNDVWFGSVQASVVNDIFPTDFYEVLNSAYISKFEELIYCHFLFKLLHVFLINLFNMGAHCRTTWNVRLLQLFMKK
jgi:hypothetical protein